MRNLFVAIFASIFFTAPAFADDMVVAMLDTNTTVDTADAVTSAKPLEVTIIPMATENAVTPAERLRELNLAFTTKTAVPDRAIWIDDALPVNGMTWDTLVIDWKGEVADPKVRKDLDAGRIVFLVKKIEKGFDPSPYNDADKTLKDVAGIFWKWDI